MEKDTVQEQYNQAVSLIEGIFKKLFIDMLKYKESEVEEEYENLEYRKLAILVPKYYPQYTQNIINLTHAEYREDNTYLDVINIMLYTYSYFQDTYKNELES